MDNKLLKKAATQSVALLITVVMVSYFLQNDSTIAASDNSSAHAYASTQAIIPVNKEYVIETNSNQEIINLNDIYSPEVAEVLEDVDVNIVKKLGRNFILIQKPQEDNIDINLKDLYITHSISVELAGLKEGVMSNNMVLRVNEDKLYTDTPVNQSDEEIMEVFGMDNGGDIIHRIDITSETDEITDLVTIKMLLELDSVYIHYLYEDDNYYIIDLKKPKEVYDKVIVIDAGHGGKDGGALSKGKQYYEKNVNRDIAFQLKQMLDQTDIKVYYSRTEDNTVFLRPRVTLANLVDCDYFVSIHCNASESTAPGGTEILYYDKEAKGVKNYDLANLFSEEIAGTIPLKKRGLVQKHKDDIFILEQAAVPAILIEVGYMTNNTDMDYLSSPSNRKAVAQGIYNSILRAYEELPVQE